MRRRIIKQQTAYTVTLPIEWIRDRNLKSKDEVEIEESQDNLIISSSKNPKVEETSIYLENGAKEYIRIMIENHYLKGYDILKIEFEDRKDFFYVQEVVSNLIGFEILEQGDHFCKIGIAGSPSIDQFNSLLNRSFNIISYTQENVLEDINSSSFKNLKEIESQSKDARRFLLFCTRTLHKLSLVSRRDESFMHLLLERLILIEHNSYYLYKKICDLKNLKIRKEVKDLYLKSTKMFFLFREMFFKKNLKNFSLINKMWEEIYFKEGHKLFIKCSKEESIIIYHSIHLSKLIFLISQPNIAGIKIV